MPEVTFEHAGAVWTASRVLDPKRPECPWVLRLRLAPKQRATPTGTQYEEAREIAAALCSPAPKITT